MTRVLVTGGSGFIGRNFCLRASDMGMSIDVLSRNKAAAAKRLPSGVMLFENLHDLPEDYAPDVVLNLAGEALADGRWTPERKKAFYDSRVGTTEQLFEFFRHKPLKPGLLISGSAIGFYGPGEEETDENTPPVDGFSHQLCQAWEQSAQRFETLSCRVCLIRTGIVLGSEGALAKMLTPFKLGLGGPIGHGQQWMSWIHIDDMIDLILHCITQTELTGAINATAPNPARNREFTRALGRVLARPTLLPMPAFMVKLLFGEMGEELLLQGQCVIPRKVLTSGFTFQHPALEGALRDLLKK